MVVMVVVVVFQGYGESEMYDLLVRHLVGGRRGKRTKMLK